MIFEILFNQTDFYDDDFLINELGGKSVQREKQKYPPYDRIMIEVRDFEHLEEILKKADEKYKKSPSAVITFNPPIIFIEL